MFTYHVDPVGNPDSVNVTLYVTSENVTASGNAFPLTVKLPPVEDHDLLTVAMLYEYVPLGSEKVIDAPVPENVCPLLRFAYHVVP